jgi:hypothetical protein
VGNQRFLRKLLSFSRIKIFALFEIVALRG